MTAAERLREAIDQEERRLRAAIPVDREAATVALVRARDHLPNASAIDAPPDLITGRRLADPGGNKALRLCLAADDDQSDAVGAPAGDLDAWAERFLDACGRLAEAELVLTHVETGFMRLVDEGQDGFAAWIATKRPPSSWRERADIDWWAAWLARRHAPDISAILATRSDDGVLRGDASFQRLADISLEMMGYQLGYPPDALLGGLPVRTYRNVLRWLIAATLRARDRGEEPAPQSERALVAALAPALTVPPAVAGQALDAFTLDRENAAYHAAVPGVAAAPLVRVGADRVVWSVRGLTTEPFLFLTRELRRRAPEAYHNAAVLREDVFRQDLYSLFPDKRFVTSPGRIALRRDDGHLRTDIDAAIFDRKSGALALFELKSQDPFARTAAELARQRDNLLYANRQVSGVLAWVQRHGANEIVARIDARTAKTFRAYKVYPFVLGRYLARFPDGPEPDRRAAWGTWPQLLRLLGGETVHASEGNPLASLFSRLSGDAPPIRPPAADAPSQEISLGDARLTIYPSYAALQAGAAAHRGRR